MHSASMAQHGGNLGRAAKEMTAPLRPSPTHSQTTTSLNRHYQIKLSLYLRPLHLYLSPLHVCNNSKDPLPQHPLW